VGVVDVLFFWLVCWWVIFGGNGRRERSRGGGRSRKVDEKTTTSPFGGHFDAKSFFFLPSFSLPRRCRLRTRILHRLQRASRPQARHCGRGRARSRWPMHSRDRRDVRGGAALVPLPSRREPTRWDSTGHARERAVSCDLEGTGAYDCEGRLESSLTFFSLFCFLVVKKKK